MKKITLIFLSEDSDKKVILKSTNQSANPETLVKSKEGNKEEQEDSSITQMPTKLYNMLMEMAKTAGFAKDQNSPTSKSDMAAFAKEIANAIRQDREGGATRLFGLQPLEPEDIDPEDVLSPPAMLFTYSFKYSIYDDMRNGRAVSIPLGAVKFNPIHRKVSNTGGKSIPVYSNTAVAMIHSKKQLEWLKKHSLFNIKFFENLGAAKNVKPDQADRLATAFATVQNLQGYQLRTRCLNEGIKIDNVDESVLKQKLINKIAERLEVEETRIKENNVKSQMTKEVEVLGG